MTNTQFTEHPPVPQVLQEALKDYPPLLAELECRLQTVGRDPGMSKDQLTDQFEAAIAVLETALGGFVASAARDCRQAESTGDANTIERAKARHALMFDCRSGLTDAFGELRAFFA